nr:hypothetical protein [Tanacetum cinerariifolium]
MPAESTVPQLVDKKGGSYFAINPRLEPRKFNKWKKANSLLFNRLPEKWLGFSQGLRNTNHTQTLDLADIYESLLNKLRDEEEVFDDEEMIQVKVLMALADDELTVGKNHARNGSESLTPLSSLKIFRKLLQALSKYYKAQPYNYASPSKQILKAKVKPLPPCIHCGFNGHRPDDCRNYHECEICRSYDQFTSRYNRVILVRGGALVESSKSSESSVGIPTASYKVPTGRRSPTASVEGCHCQKKSEATARKIALLC